MITVQNLQKSFASKQGKQNVLVPAVKQVSFTAPNASITGLLGPNGAGKTTTLRIVSTLIKADSGTVEIDGINVQTNPNAALDKLGVLADARGLYTRLSARENISYYGKLRGLSDQTIEANTQKLVELLDLGSLIDRRTEGFSQGERMKVALARSLIHDPANVVLDEPTNGLDIQSTRNLREMIKRLRDAGKCIVFSTHIMQEVERLCDDIVIVAQGTTIAHGTQQQLLQMGRATNLEDAFVNLAFEPATH